MTARKTAGKKTVARPRRKAGKLAGKTVAAKKAVQAKKKTTRKVVRRVGRPTVFSAAVASKICALVADGKTWRDVAKKPGMPALRTLARWMSENEEFWQQHARAREARAEVLLADFEKERKKLSTCRDHVKIRAIEVNINALKWLMAKFYRRVYGDKLDVEATVTPVEMTYDYSRLSDAELELLEGLLSKAEIVKVES